MTQPMKCSWFGVQSGSSSQLGDFLCARLKRFAPFARSVLFTDHRSLSLAPPSHRTRISGCISRSGSNQAQQDDMVRGQFSPSTSLSSSNSTAIDLIQEDVELGTRRPREDSTASSLDDCKKEPTNQNYCYEVEELGSANNSAGRTTRSSSSAAPDNSITERTPSPQLSAFETNLLAKYHSILPNLEAKSPPIVRRLVSYFSGPSPAITETQLGPFPFLPFVSRIERFLDQLFSPISKRRTVITPVFLFAWFLAFTFLVKASFFSSTTSAGSSPSFIVGSSSFWTQNAGCGMNGTLCEPFVDSSFLFRCPSKTLSVMLLNQRAVGAKSVNFVPLVVGGFDELNTYRADSWICAAAIQQGLFGNSQGGCGFLEMTGTFQGFMGGSAHGVNSVGFDSTFPSSYRFTQGVSQANCKDLSNNILGFNVAMSFIFSLIIRYESFSFCPCHGDGKLIHFLYQTIRCHILLDSRHGGLLARRHDFRSNFFTS